MIYEITNETGIDWTAKGHDRILQNVVNLLNTDIYEIPYARTIGIDKSIIDKPAGAAAEAMVNDMISLIEKREPRANIQSITIDGIDSSGKIKIKAVVEIE